MAGTLPFQLICVLLHLIIYLSVSSANQENVDDGEVRNVSVPLGRTTSLRCTLPDQSSQLTNASYEVSWIRQGDDTVVSVNNKIITRNHRLIVSTDHLTYSRLQITQVKESDRGCYRCQINSTTVSTQITCIDVLVSPEIEESSVDLVVNEGEDTTLICKAIGHPQPQIYWRREDGRLINQEKVVTGSVLRLTQIRRDDSGPYLCTATNNVPPSVVKRIFLNVNYRPEVDVEESRVGCEEGKDVRLVCNCFASPTPQIIWLFNQVVISHSQKYSLDKEEFEGAVSSGLRLHSVGSGDFGYYTCECSNIMGRRFSSLQLYKIKETTSKPDTFKVLGKGVMTDSISDDDVGITEIDDNSLRSMTSAKASSIRVAAVEPYLSDSSHHHHHVSSSTRIIASFIFIAILNLHILY